MIDGVSGSRSSRDHDDAGEYSPSGLSEFARRDADRDTRPPVAALAAPRAGFDPHEIFRTISKWRILIILSLIAGPLIALGLSLLITPMYAATSQIEVNSETPEIIPGAEGARPIIVNNNQFLATQLGLLRSESLAQRVVDAQRLASNPAYANQELDARQRRDAAAAVLRSQVTFNLIRESRLVDIRAESPDPTVAANIANSYAEEFIASNLQRDFDATAYARNLLEKRLQTTKARLETSERALVAYAARQGIVEIGGDGEGGGQSSLDAASLVSLNESLTQARADRIAAEQRFRQAAGSGTTTEMIGNPTIQTLTAQRAQVQAEYQEKLATFTPALPAMVALRDRIESLDREIARATSNVRNSLQSEYRAAVAREQALQQRVNGLQADVLDLRDRSIQYTILQREVDTNRALYDALLQRFRQVGVSDGVGDNKIAIVDRARASNAPVSPNVPVNILIGLLLGAVAGFGGAFLIEFIDDTIKLPEDVPNKLDLTLLGVMPLGDTSQDFATQIDDPKSDITEASYSLRTALQFATDHGVPRSLLVTSSRPGEGKSSISLTLATAFGRLGKRVLLIDADMRKPTFYVQGKSRQVTVGLSNLLVGQEKLSEAIHATELRNVALMPAGPNVPSPAELLSTSAFRELLDNVGEMYDVVVVDGPPVLGLADAPLLGSYCDATLIVIETAAIRRTLAANAVARLRAANARVIGGVLNKFNPRKVGYGYGYGYGYAYSYSYGDEKATDEGRKIAISN